MKNVNCTVDSYLRYEMIRGFENITVECEKHIKYSNKNEHQRRQSYKICIW